MTFFVGFMGNVAIEHILLDKSFIQFYIRCCLSKKILLHFQIFIVENGMFIEIAKKIAHYFAPFEYHTLIEIK